MIRMAAVMLAFALMITGCANPKVATVAETRISPGYTAPRPVEPVRQSVREPDRYRNTDSGRGYSLSLSNASLADVLKLLSRESGVSIIAERGVEATVNIEANGKKLGDLLYAILKPLALTASVENGVIIVGRPQLATRTFRVNYLKDTRSSTSNMNVSGFSAGSVSVSTQGKSDFWKALEDSLELMVFGSSGKGKRDGGGFVRGDENDQKQQPTAVSTPGGVKQGAQPQNSMTINRENAAEPSTQQLVATGDNSSATLKLKQLMINEIAGIIQVTDLPENLDRIAAFLADVEEGSKRQVMIQAHIMEVTLKDSYSMGIDWKYVLDKTTNLTFAQALVPSNPTNVFKLSAAASDFSVLMDAMKEQGNLNMLSSPKITALNNQKAVIKLTTKQVSWVSSKTTQNNAIGGQDTYTTTPQVDEVGIFLDVTPQIGQDNSITMQIHPSVSEIKELSISPDKSSTKPIIDVREIDTMVDAKAGDTIVIAGLISDKLSETKRSVPLLGDIPLMGSLFSYNSQSRNKAELVIMMTPYILNSKSIAEIREEHEKRMKNIGGTFHLINNIGSLVTEERSREFLKTNGITTPPHHAVNSESLLSGQVTNAPALKPVEEKKDAPEKKTTDEQVDKEPAIKLPPKKIPGRPIIPPPQEQGKIEVKTPAVSEESSVMAQKRMSAISVFEPSVTPPRKKEKNYPHLLEITAEHDKITVAMNNVTTAPKLLKERKNGRMILKLNGVKSEIGDANIILDTLGFARAKISRHPEGIWVVFHSQTKPLPDVDASFTNGRLVITASKEILPAVNISAVKVERKRKTVEPAPSVAESTISPAVETEAIGVAKRVLPEEKRMVEQIVTPELRDESSDKKMVTVVSTATSDAQSLYRDGVAAYKAGKCGEAVEILSKFITQYPDSPFTPDAAVYRDDCSASQNR